MWLYGTPKFGSPNFGSSKSRESVNNGSPMTQVTFI
jgi:hypothetical protein